MERYSRKAPSKYFQRCCYFGFFFPKSKIILSLNHPIIQLLFIVLLSPRSIQAWVRQIPASWSSESIGRSWFCLRYAIPLWPFLSCRTSVLTSTFNNRASSRREWKVSWVFWICGRNLGYILELQRGCPFETLVFSLKSVPYCLCRNYSILPLQYEKNRQP